MRIAVQAADLDHARIDGTRVYLSEILRRIADTSLDDQWYLFHRTRFNPALKPPVLPRTTVHAVPFPLVFWTQTRFAWELFRLRPDRLWMPVQALPFCLPQGVESTVTIHDLAFRFFPEAFHPRTRRRLEWFTRYAVRHATRLIAVSAATRDDILRLYPGTPEGKIRVIHHAVGASWSLAPDPARTLSCLERHSLQPDGYFLYVGAIQPRKNLVRLLDAFALIKAEYPRHKLVLAGEPAWLSGMVLEAVATHPFRDDVVLTGRVEHEDLKGLYRNASLFVFPSLYEGFGLPLLEAFVSGTPVVCGRHSSLAEVGGEAVQYADVTDTAALAESMRLVLSDPDLRRRLVAAGRERAALFSWDRAARETRGWIVGEE